MTWLIWKIRSWFCKHEFEFNEAPCTTTWHDDFGYKTDETKGLRVSAICKKCSFNRSFWKF